ncbi:protease [Lithospermum erythrorhizon]|uniref:Protease n=1 Tax=Lithospermum erythrorhizon TaxID=34254 RepID=A0AAV3RRJ7_LITER
MACSHYIIVFCSLLLIATSSITAQTPSAANALVLPVTKDASTNQYITTIKQRTPLVPINLTLYLGGQFLWVDCEQGYVSSTYSPALCGSPECSLANSDGCGTCNSPPRPGCNNNTCGLFPENPIIRTSTGGELATDVVSLQSTNGTNPGGNATVPDYLFVCGPTFLLEGLASGVTGIAGLGRTNISLPAQFSDQFNFNRTFAICLSPSTSSRGVMFFGDGPYLLLPNVDASMDLIYTPLIINPVSTAGVSTAGEPSAEYFIGVSSIEINENVVPINITLLEINSEGVGGTKISTVDQYTVLESSIYNAVVDTFVRELANATRVGSVAPFGACFNSTSIGSTRVGPGVPNIDLVLQNETVYWRIFGANSMVQVSSDVLCLGFVDGGVNPRTSIVIGGHQIEDNLLQFDVEASTLGFSSSLLFRQTTCANFNFTSSV